jgi:8-oxo-dGTP pyrophosphatase MutT (NUDIX family)
VIDEVHGFLLRVFRRLPARARRTVVRSMTPSFYVGAICLVQRDDGRRLFVRHTYRRRWGTPGGLLGRNEDIRDAARREALEEIGLRVELVGEPTVVVDPASRRVDVIFAARPADDEDPDAARPRSPEIAECRWFAPDALPPLQHETAGALVTLARARRPGEAVDRLDPAPRRSGRSTTGRRSGAAASRGRAPRSGGSAPG